MTKGAWGADLIPRAPPIAWLALALTAGAAAGGLGLLTALPFTPFLFLPLLLWRRLRATCAIALAFTVGVALGRGERELTQTDCRTLLADSAALVVRGAFEAIPGSGGAPFIISEADPGGCSGRVRAVLRRSGRPPSPGDEILARGRWMRREPEGVWPRTPYDAGTLLLDSTVLARRASLTQRPLLYVRGNVQYRLRALLGNQAGVAEALVLARKEGLEPSQRETFALAGVAHLLAISGFHVGVVAGVLLALARIARLDRRRSGLAAVLGTWVYVLGIGAPYSAVRAVAMLTLMLAGRLLGRPADPLGVLAGAALVMVVGAPGAILDIGFQLSFAAVAGLLVLQQPIARSLAIFGQQRRGEALRNAVAAGLAATLATAPLTALHFGRVSLVGIPLTLILTPLVCLAIPQIALVLLVSTLWDGGARFLAGGLSLILGAVTRATEIAAEVPGGNLIVPREWLYAAAAGTVVAWLVLLYAPPLRRAVRNLVVVVAAAAAVLLLPLIRASGGGAELSLFFLDVGQGDATALRSPLGRWMLVDAGPRSDQYDAGARVVVPFLQRQGAGRLEALFLTHSDLDHIGGAASVLDGLDVTAVVDPGRAASSGPYVDLLERIDGEGIRWIEGRAGKTLSFDGVRIDIAHPPPGPLDLDGEANDESLVLRVSYGSFAAFLMGDAPEAAEQVVLGSSSDLRVSLLKVGHHGSATSTSPALLAASRPQVAVISSGRGNQFGHPAPSVVARLVRAGIRTLRTDQVGTIRVDASPDGTLRVTTGREAAGQRIPLRWGGAAHR